MRLERGFALSRVSEADAERLNKWERQRLKELDEPAPEQPRYRAGEIVVVDQWSNVHHLNFANTGQHQPERDQRFRDINPDDVLTVAGAESAMRKNRQQRHEERRQLRQQQYEERMKPARERHWPVMPLKEEGKGWPAFQEAAQEAGRDKRTENLKGAAAKVWEAWTRIDEEKYAGLIEKGVTFSARMAPKNFAALIDEKGITFARATKEEAERSQREASFARELGHYAPRFKEGEIVLITEPPFEYQRNGEMFIPGRVQKLDQALAEKFVKAIGNGSQLQSIEATLKLSDERAAQRAAEREATRLERATDIDRFAPVASVTKTPAAIGRTSGRALAGVLEMGMSAAGILFSFIDPQKTPAQLKHEAIREEARREVEIEKQIDFSKYSAEAAAEQRNQQEHQAARAGNGRATGNDDSRGRGDPPAQSRTENRD
jgi:hypothetical protein